MFSLLILIPLGFIAIIYVASKSKNPVMITEEDVDKVNKMINDNAILVVSKTYCPYCKSAIKTLFQQHKVPVADVLVLQLDEMKDGPAIQQALYEINGQSTVPHIYIGKKFVGGNDQLQKLNKSGKLKTMLQNAVKI